MTADTLILIIYCLTFGIVVAFIWSLLTKAIYGRLIDELIKNECESESSAMTLQELSIKKSFFLSASLKKGRALDKLLSKAEGERYYLSPENRLKAQCLYGRERVSVLTLIFTFILFGAVLAICTFVIPLIMN